MSDLKFARPCPVTTLSIPIYIEQPVIVINQPVPSAATPQQSCVRMSGAKKPSAERPPVQGACVRSRTYRGDSRMDSGMFHLHVRPNGHLNRMDLIQRKHRREEACQANRGGMSVSGTAMPPLHVVLHT